MHNIKSPLTKKSNILLDAEIETNYLIYNYKIRCKIDVSKYFDKIDRVSIYKCLDTNYRFYYPFSLAGDGSFYEKLQKYDWYYMPWKWEHQTASKLLEESMSVLEVGCATGEFLSKISSNVKKVTGLELNLQAMEEAHKKGINVYNEMIETHANNFNESYDFVCSFQVLEHISDVYSFISAQTQCLKKGGLLWISVPNNDSFFMKDWRNEILNMPPHHMGLWNENSLRSLENIFPIKLQNIIFEPLQQYHYQWYQNILENTIKRNKLQSFIYYRLGGRRRMYHSIARNAKKIKGHTIAAIFRKND